jgi:signal transduction histidine kinase
LRDLGRTSERALETIELASFAKRVLAPFAEKLPGGTKLAIADGVAVTTVADPVELDRILVNLVLSAAQAARGGEVQVEIGGDDQIASISVRDRAKPIDDVGELMRRTEGIELSVVAAATRDIGGLLHIDSREGEGTTIRVELPRV